MITHKVSEQACVDALETALNTTMWARVLRSTSIKGGYMIEDAYDTVDEDGAPKSSVYIITPGKMRKGFERIVMREPGCDQINSSFFSAICAAAFGDPKVEILDADTADLVLQAAIFGKIIYG